jgi:alpha-L-fucosidase
MKTNVLIICLSALFLASCGDEATAPASYGATPSEAQLKWHDTDFYGMICISTITYTDEEWGYGDEPASLFNPELFDAREMVGVMKAAGMKGVLLVAKHHGGFCLWPTSTTDYSVKSSPWRDGKGDMVREFADAAREAGLKFGVYNSPWDRNDADYGRPEYIRRYREQLRELHTNYGDIFISWYDGANGGDGYYGGAREMRKLDDLDNYYGWEEVKKLVREWQPDAVTFNIGDIRWVGNEGGYASDPCWATFDVAKEGSIEWIPTSGQRNGKQWMPAECDVPIRPGWFYHASMDDKVKTSEQLFDLYFRSVRLGQAFDIGLAPDMSGRLHPNDVRSLKGLGQLINSTFAVNLAADARISVNNKRGKDYSVDNLTDNDKTSYWATNDKTTEGLITLEWKEPCTFSIISLREYLPLGQRIDSVAVEIFNGGQWTAFANVTSIGANRLIRAKKPVEASKVRIRTFGPVCPALSEIGVYLEAKPAPVEKKADDQGVSKAKWKMMPAGSDTKAFDGDVATVWKAAAGGKQELCIDLGESITISEFVYTPDDSDANGLITKYELYISDKSGQWGKAVAADEFGNIRNNPLPQSIRLAKPLKGRYIRLAANETINDAPMAVAEVGVR